MTRAVNRKKEILHQATDAILESVGVLDLELRSRLAAAFSLIPREIFFEPEYQDYAFDDVAIPIGFAQTSSKPSTLFRLIGHTLPRAGEKILEVGSGCGYFLALLASLYREQRSSARTLRVYGLEKRVALASRARKHLDSLMMSDVLVQCSDGALGWREHAPFDVIYLSAAFPTVPDHLLMQLNLGGRLIAPIIVNGGRESQRLRLWTRVSTTRGVQSDFEVEDCGECSFVIAV